MRILCSPTWDGDLLTLLAVHKERVFVVSVSAMRANIVRTFKVYRDRIMGLVMSYLVNSAGLNLQC
ncbi:hypothetical protein BDV35DRAFT_368400 [Aspergillus flavus]|uniref:Uncharacterized protein n=1 Tax=Aspergillus flavus TaxID=5059 RepID=A0A5N6GL90_ASPFL|nr:hypothetical protein BDV35DRAFT_368400 [Aspergillus flavus]